MLLRSLLLALFLSAPTLADDWPRFLGPDGDGVHDQALPTEWSVEKNVQWSVDLPGKGSSSPVIYGERIYLTCWSGYGMTREAPGDIDDLTRHVCCYDLNSGEQLWQTTIEAVQPEDPYQGFLTEHGYASSTPVCDGERLYVFLGKSGMFAFDLDGKKLWQTDVGRSSSNRRWGSAASPVLYENLVIVNASEESNAIYGLDKTTGKEVWKQSADLLELAYTTPVITKTVEGEDILLTPVPQEIWGLNPKTGKLRFYLETRIGGNLSPTAVIDGTTAYIYGGIREAGSLAMTVGGKGDISDSNTQWTNRVSSYVATPVLYEGHLYWVDDRGLAHCQNAKTGEEVYRERMPSGSGGRPFYASPIIADGKVYVTSRKDGVYVLPAKPEFEILATNELDDDSEFNATPAAVGGKLILRSDAKLYCISE